MAIAVLDIGKTNAKAILLDEAGAVLAQRSRPSAGLKGPPYPRLDLDGVWAWAQGALAELAAMAPVRCVVPVAHGAAGVLMAGARRGWNGPRRCQRLSGQSQNTSERTSILRRGAASAADVGS